MLPFELVVRGTPVSHQTRNRTSLRAWSRVVRAAALASWPAGQAPLDSPLKVTVVYFHQGKASRLDLDNLLKPVLDALIGVVYRDDKLITDASLRKSALEGAFIVNRMPLVLVAALARGEEFIYLRVEAQPDHQELL